VASCSALQVYLQAINTANNAALDRDLLMYAPAQRLTYTTEDMTLNPISAKDRCLLKGVPLLNLFIYPVAL